MVIFLDPFDKSVGLRPPQSNADAVLVSHGHHDHSNIDSLRGNPVVIDSPGEYSVKGVHIIGIDSFHDETEGTERGRNTIFVLEAEELRLCHLGDLGCDLTPKQLESINGVDILFVPVGGKYTIDGIKAAEIVRQTEPSIVIPMHYKTKGSSVDISDEKDFCSEMGDCERIASGKLSLKKKDLEGRVSDPIILGIGQ